MWNAVLKAGKKHKLRVIAPAHHRRIQAGILSWGQDMDMQHNPFQCNLGYQVSLSGKGGMALIAILTSAVSGMNCLLQDLLHSRKHWRAWHLHSPH